MLDDGYLFVIDEAGEGQTFKLKSHTTEAKSANFVVTLYDNDSVRTALTTSSQVGFQKALGSDVEVWDADDITGPPLGVPACDVASGAYFWNQVKGPAAVLATGTVVLGKNVMTANADGTAVVMADDSSAEFLIGGVLAVAASGEYSFVDLNIRG